LSFIWANIVTDTVKQVSSNP